MKRSVLRFVLSVMALVPLLASCEKEEYARVPVYGNMTFNPDMPNVGDTVTIRVKIVDPGHRIYHADYKWRCNGQFSNTVAVTAPDNSKVKTIVDDPTFKWVFQNTGSYEVTFSSTVKFSMADENGSLGGVGVTQKGTTQVVGKIRVR